jgi:flagellar export protein FliJ
LSSQHLKSSLKRLDRLSDIRRAFVVAAEARLAEAQHQVAVLEKNADATAREIRSVLEEAAYVQRTSGEHLHATERFLELLRDRAKRISQELSTAAAMLELRRNEWSEAMRDQKVVTRIQERRQRDWERQNAVENQKESDIDSVMRRTRQTACE